jgi:hypothetical protein
MNKSQSDSNITLSYTNTITKERKMTEPFKSLTTEQMLEVYKKVMGPARIELVGDEYNEIKSILDNMEPLETSNNQRTITEVYKLARTTYHVHYGIYDYPIIEKLL